MSLTANFNSLHYWVFIMKLLYACGLSLLIVTPLAAMENGGTSNSVPKQSTEQKLSETEQLNVATQLVHLNATRVKLNKELSSLIEMHKLAPRDEREEFLKMKDDTITRMLKSFKGSITDLEALMSGLKDLNGVKDLNLNSSEGAHLLANIQSEYESSVKLHENEAFEMQHYIWRLSNISIYEAPTTQVEPNSIASKLDILQSPQQKREAAERAFSILVSSLNTQDRDLKEV